MNKIVSFGIFLMLVACQNKISQEELTLLKGYWEIEKVTLANGQTKEYNVNTTLDYIEVKELSGYRKKSIQSLMALLTHRMMQSNLQ